jgi:hypothetical protein
MVLLQNMYLLGLDADQIVDSVALVCAASGHATDLEAM